MDALDKQVVKELRRERVKLWLPPFHENGKNNEHELGKLATEWAPRLAGSKEDVLKSLQTFQAHAVGKLASKGCAEPKKCQDVNPSTTVKSSSKCHSMKLKVLGLSHRLEKTDSFPETWAERIEVAAPNTLELCDLSPRLTVENLVDDIKKVLGVTQTRLIYKGTTLSTRSDKTLTSELLPQAGNELDDSDVTVLCLVSYTEEETKAVSLPSRTSSWHGRNSDQTLIDSIRRGAGRFRSGARFEITDQKGRHVSMSHSDRLAFLTALGLHRIGRTRVDISPTSALVFLLEADEEWSRVGLHEWRDRVDNYGLLQLDIAWVYLQLESLSSLPDVLRRLEVAEKVLRKQVHTNFVTLALANADMGNAVPPLAAVFVRLFLLQGVGYKYCTSIAAKSKSRERLDWARSLCQALRRATPSESVQGLCEAMGVSEFIAVSALRRSNGNADAAADLVARDEKDAQQEKQQRDRQRRLGLCENGMDYVNLNLLTQLQSMLLPTTPTQNGDNRASSGEGETSLSSFEQGRANEEFRVTAGLLRLANNDIGRAVDIYQELQQSGDMVLHRVAGLDQKLQMQRSGLPEGRTRNMEQDNGSDKPVDDVALATLVSLGVDEKQGRRALKHTQNNVDLSLLWLASQSDREDRESGAGAHTVESTGNSLQKRMSTSAFDSNAASTPHNSSNVSGTRTDLSRSSDGPDRDRTNFPGGPGDFVENEEEEEDEAQIMLEQELGQVIQERDLEKEYFGNSLEEEWHFINKYCSSE